MVTINYDSELRRAGANANTFWGRLRFFARRYVLGTVGLVIMILFVFAALFADRMDLFAGGGVTVRDEILDTVRAACLEKSGVTHVVLLKGCGGQTDVLADDMSWVPAEASASAHVKIHVVDIEKGPDEMRRLLRETSRV